MVKYERNTITKCTKFFKLRFPDKELLFEMQCGYFFEWCDRFEKNVKQYCDQESLDIVLKMEKD
jgi:hypothetical protein